jgi:hypothetical protein
LGRHAPAPLHQAAPPQSESTPQRKLNVVEAVLLPAVGSGVVALRTAVVVVDPGVPEAVTFTVMGTLAPPAIVARVHVSAGAAKAHAHPAPEKPWYVTPAGSVRTTCAPLASLGPAFDTPTVYAYAVLTVTLAGA